MTRLTIRERLAMEKPCPLPGCGALPGDECLRLAFADRQPGSRKHPHPERLRGDDEHDERCFSLSADRKCVCEIGERPQGAGGKQDG